jgi:hypothetical protein
LIILILDNIEAKQTDSIVILYFKKLTKADIRFKKNEKQKMKGFDIKLRCFAIPTNNKTLLFCMHNTQNTVRQKIFTPGISELTVQRGRVRSEILNKNIYKTTACFFVIPPLSQF